MIDFSSKVANIRSIYRRQRLVDLRAIRPLMNDLSAVIESRPDADFRGQFRLLINDLPMLKSNSDVIGIIHILDFCMRRFKWSEIESALKEIYPSIASPDTKLEVERLIKNIYDPKWDQGQFEFLIPDDNIWEL